MQTEEIQLAPYFWLSYFAMIKVSRWHSAYLSTATDLRRRSKIPAIASFRLPTQGLPSCEGRCWPSSGAVLEGLDAWISAKPKKKWHIFWMSASNVGNPVFLCFKGRSKRHHLWRAATSINTGFSFGFWRGRLYAVSV